MRKLVLLVLLFACSGCVTPNVWVESRTPSSGVIGYQNYDPKTDDGKLITSLIPCENHTMTWNGQKSRATGAATYYYASGLAAPVDDGVIRWVEYHYECPKNSVLKDKNQ